MDPHSRNTLPWHLVMLLVPLLGVNAAFAQREHVSYETFAQWKALVPELAEARVCGLTAAAHTLWETGQLRLPSSTFLRNDFSGTGRQDWAISLVSDDELSPCTHLLIVTRDAEGWSRLFFHRVGDAGQRSGFTPLWSVREQSIGVDYGERVRETGAATMIRKDGQVVEAREGYVIEKAIIRESVRWDSSSKSYQYRVTEQSEAWRLDELL